jgi:hypothetical protein
MSMPNIGKHANVAGTFSLFVFLIPMLLGDVSTTGASTDWYSVAAVLSHGEALSGAHDVELSGNLAFVPGKGGSLAIVDISTPEEPNLLWFRHEKMALEDAQTVLPVGQHLLLGTRDFFSTNISNPQEPIFLNKVADRSEGRIDRINGMVRYGNHVFAANKAGWIDAFDITDINLPKLFGALNVRERFGLLSPHDIDMHGGYVVIVSPNRFGRNPTGKLAVFAVFDRDNERLLPPREWKLKGLVAAKELRGANRVQISGSFAFTGGSFSPSVRKEGPGIYANLGVVDLSDPGRPQVVASQPFGDTRNTRGPNGLTVAGEVVFLAGGETVEAVDISDPYQPSRLGSQRLPASNVKLRPTRRTDNAHDLVYRDGYLYVSCQSDYSLMILRITDKKVLHLAKSK